MKKNKNKRPGAEIISKAGIKRFFPLYCMMLPGLLYIFINNYLPLVGLQLPFKKFSYAKGIFASKWIGFDNFEFLFKTRDLWIIIRNTLGYNLVFIVLGTVISIATAIFLDSIKSNFSKKIYQTSILLPFLISYVVVSYIVFAFLSPSNGMINNGILKSLGLDGVDWYVEAGYWPAILILVNTWKIFGYSSIIYYATIVGIDNSFYEAAIIDGAGTFRQITSITLPMLKKTIITLTLLSIGRIFFSDFGLFYQVPMNSGLLYDVTNTIDTYVYRGLIVLNDIGRSSAAGFFQSVMGFLMVLIANSIVKKIEPEDALF